MIQYIFLLCLSVVTPQAAPPAEAPLFNADYELDGGDHLTGTTTFAIDEKGRVSGALKLTKPLVVSAALSGQVKNQQWTFSYPITLVSGGRSCKGTMAGKATVLQGEPVKGSATIKGHCENEAMENWTTTFTFTPKPNL